MSARDSCKFLKKLSVFSDEDAERRGNDVCGVCHFVATPGAVSR